MEDEEFRKEYAKIQPKEDYLRALANAKNTPQEIAAKEALVQEYIAKYDPYKSRSDLNFDLRGYADYLQKSNIPSEAITPEIMEKFVRKN